MRVLVLVRGEVLRNVRVLVLVRGEVLWNVRVLSRFLVLILPCPGKREGPKECDSPGPGLRGGIEECEGPLPASGPHPSWSWSEGRY